MISVLQTTSTVEELVPEWDELWRADEEATPFQSPHWILPWWRQFGTPYPCVATKRAGSTLTGVLPLYVLGEEAKLLPMGAGTTDYIDAVGESAPELLEASLQTAMEADIQICDLMDVRPGSALIGRSSLGWSADWVRSTTCPVLTLGEIPKVARRKLQLSRNRAARAGGWTIETASQATLSWHLDLLVRFHTDRWRAQGESGALSDERVLAFWHDAAPTLLQAGILRLQCVKVGGQPAASIAALLSPSRIYFYLSGFDQGHSYVSPGVTLLGAMLEQAHREGRAEAHFLRGPENYKYVWGAEDRLNWFGHIIHDRSPA